MEGAPRPEAKTEPVDSEATKKGEQLSKSTSTGEKDSTKGMKDIALEYLEKWENPAPDLSKEGIERRATRVTEAIELAKTKRAEAEKKKGERAARVAEVIELTKAKRTESKVQEGPQETTPKDWEESLGAVKAQQEKAAAEETREVSGGGVQATKAETKGASEAAPVTLEQLKLNLDNARAEQLKAVHDHEEARRHHIGLFGRTQEKIFGKKDTLEKSDSYKRAEKEYQEAKVGYAQFLLKSSLDEKGVPLPRKQNEVIGFVEEEMKAYAALLTPVSVEKAGLVQKLWRGYTQMPRGNRIALTLALSGVAAGLVSFSLGASAAAAAGVLGYRIVRGGIGTAVGTISTGLYGKYRGSKIERQQGLQRQNVIRGLSMTNMNDAIKTVESLQKEREKFDTRTGWRKALIAVAVGGTTAGTLSLLHGVSEAAVGIPIAGTGADLPPGPTGAAEIKDYSIFTGPHATGAGIDPRTEGPPIMPMPKMSFPGDIQNPGGMAAPGTSFPVTSEALPDITPPKDYSIFTGPHATGAGIDPRTETPLMGDAPKDYSIFTGPHATGADIDPRTEGLPYAPGGSLGGVTFHVGPGDNLWRLNERMLSTNKDFTTLNTAQKHWMLSTIEKQYHQMSQQDLQDRHFSRDTSGKFNVNNIQTGQEVKLVNVSGSRMINDLLQSARNLTPEQQRSILLNRLGKR